MKKSFLLLTKIKTASFLLFSNGKDVMGINAREIGQRIKPLKNIDFTENFSLCWEGKWYNKSWLSGRS